MCTDTQHCSLLLLVHKHMINTYACQQSHRIHQNHHCFLLNKSLNAMLAQTEKISTLFHAGETTLPCSAHCASHHDLQETDLGVTKHRRISALKDRLQPVPESES